MALPPQAIERLTQEGIRAPGWSGRMLMFASILFALSLATWLGLSFGYNKALEAEIGRNEAKIKSMGQADEAMQNNILSMHSQIVNIDSLLKNHPYASNLFSYIEKNTHSNVYLRSLSYSSLNNQISSVGVATSPQYVAEQISLYKDDSKTKSIKLGGTRSEGVAGWSFDTVIMVDPTLLTTRPISSGSASGSGSSPSPAPSEQASSSSSTSTSQ